MDETILTQIEQRMPRFAKALGRRNLDLIVRAGSVTTVPAGTRLIEDQRPVDALYLILDGNVSVCIEQSGQRLLLGHLGPGQWFGEVSLLSGDGRASASVIADTETRFLRVHQSGFEQLLNEHAGLAGVWLRELIAEMSQRLRASGEAIRALGGGLALRNADRLIAADTRRRRGLLDVFRKLFGLDESRG